MAYQILDNRDNKANLEYKELPIDIFSAAEVGIEGKGIHILNQFYPVLQTDEGTVYSLVFGNSDVRLGTGFPVASIEYFEKIGFIIGKKYEIEMSLDTYGDPTVIDSIKAVIDVEDKVDKTAIDQTYNPESKNAQSGKAVAEAMANVGGTWEQIADITTTEEIGKFNFTIEEFPQLTNCKDFLMQMEIPKQSENISLGSFYYALETTNYSPFLYYSNSLSAASSYVNGITVRTTLIGDTFHSVGGNGGTSALKAQNYTSLGTNTLGDIEYLTIYLSGENVFPIGTKCKIYGKVEG